MIEREREREAHRHPLPSDPYFWEWLGKQPANPVSVVTANSGDISILNGEAIFCGYSLRETAAQAIVFELRDGTDATGPILAVGAFGANVASSSNLIPPGIRCERGVFLHRISGTGVLVGTVYIKLIRAR